MSEAKNVIEFIQDEKDMTTSRIYCESVCRVIVNVLSATGRNIKNLFSCKYLFKTLQLLSKVIEKFSSARKRLRKLFCNIYFPIALTPEKAFIFL